MKKIIVMLSIILTMQFTTVLYARADIGDVEDIFLDTISTIYEETLNGTNEAVTKTVADLIKQIKEHPEYPTQSEFTMPNITCFHGYRIIETINDKGIKHQFSIQDIFYYVNGTANGFFNKSELVYYNKKTGKYYKPNVLYRTYINDVGEIKQIEYNAEFTIANYSPTNTSWGLKRRGFKISAPNYSFTIDGVTASRTYPIIFTFLSYYECTYNSELPSIQNYLVRPQYQMVSNAKFVSWGDNPYGELQVFPYDNYIVDNNYQFLYSFDGSTQLCSLNTYAEIDLNSTTLMNFTTNSADTNSQIEKGTNAPDINYYYQNDLIYNNSYPLTKIENNYQTINNNINNKYPSSTLNPTISDNYKDWDEDDILFTIPKLEIPKETLPTSVLDDSATIVNYGVSMLNAIDSRFIVILLVLGVIAIIWRITGG